MILSKIPGFLQDRWNKHVDKIRENQIGEPALLNLTDLIEDEINLVNDPLFSREGIGQYEDKPLKPYKPKKTQSYAIKKTSRNKNRETSECPICKG